MHAGDFAELAGDGGPVEQQGGFGQAEAGAGGFKSGGGQGASEPAKAFIYDLLRNTAKEAEITEAGVAAKFLGGKTDGLEDLGFGHGYALSSKRSFGHFFPRKWKSHPSESEPRCGWRS